MRNSVLSGPASVANLQAVLLCLTLSGCADYLNHYDTVTLAAGDTQKQNMLLQTVDLFNPQSQDTHIGGSGIRAADAVNGYRYALRPAGAPPGNVTVNVGGSSGGGGGGGNCDYSNQTASDGSKCGGRSAEERPGGYNPP